MQLQKIGASYNSWIAHDAEGEQVENIAVNFAGVPESMDRVMMEVAAAAGMPVTLLWGRSPAGQNATGESDWQNWYEEVASYQDDVLLTPVKRLVELVMLSKQGPTGGKVPDSWKLEWNPLREMSDSERSQWQTAVATFLAVLVREQIIEPEEAALSDFFGDQGPFAELHLDTKTRQEMLDEVLAAHADRISIAGWFRRNEGPGLWSAPVL